MDNTNKLFQSRAQSELEASTHQLARNHMHAATLTHLLDTRKGVTSRVELDQLAKKWNLEGEKKLESLARFVNTPSVQGGKAVKTVGKDGEEIVTMPAVWAEPHFSGPR